jgi:signal transduction histidine kinase/CheY-like chemotaxis protein/HAMP domain-containing protein
MTDGESSFGRFARFWANLSLRFKGLLVIALPVAALVAAGFLVTRSERDRDEIQELVKRNSELRAQLLGMYIVLSSAESALRNYALTGQENGIQPLSMAGLTVDTNFDKMGAQILPNVEQIQRLADFRKRAHQRLDGMKRLHEFYDAHREDHALPPQEFVDSAKIAPDILQNIASFYAAETKLLQERGGESKSLQAKLHWGMLASLAVGILGAIWAAILFSRGIVRRIQQLENAAANLESGVPRAAVSSGNDEIGRLAKAMEKAGSILANHSHELKIALENAQCLIWDLDTVARNIHYRAASGVLDDSILPVELLAPDVDGWISGVHAEDREQVRQEFSRACNDGQAIKIEYRVVIRGGEVRWMMVKAQRYDTGAGKPERFLGLLADITERRNAAKEIEWQAHQLSTSQQALEQQTRILKSILDSMGDGVVVADTEGKLLVFNPAAQQILGRSPFAGDRNHWAEHYGLFLPDTTTLYPTDQLPFVRAIHGEAVDGAEIYVRHTGSAQSSWTSVTARPLRQDDGAIRGGIMVLRDVTAAKRTAEALELAKHEAEAANQAKSEFLSRMSHELRTPLNSILGFAQLLELADLGGQANDNIQHILKGGYHLLDLINEILDLARIESGRLSLSPEPVEIREVVADALDLVQPLAMEQRINVSAESALRCNLHVNADRQRLKQILLNLLSNAIKFNRAGGSIIVSCQDLPGNRLRIEIADSGCGISPDGMKKLFTPFERLSADRTEIGGTGLGLALSKRLIEAMGGAIGVESAVGVGSRFFIELATLEEPTKWLENHPDLLEAAQQGPAHRGTVLYIEDNASNLRLIERIMGHCPDVRLITAMQGQLGLDLAQMHVPDWILLDLHLPDLPGEEVLHRLRTHPRTKSIPVTILSADATRGQITRLLSAGARDYLTKPVDVRQLLRLLDETLKHEAPHNEIEVTYAERDHSK